LPREDDSALLHWVPECSSQVKTDNRVSLPFGLKLEGERFQMTILSNKYIRQGVCVIILTILTVITGPPGVSRSDAQERQYSDVNWRCSPTPSDALGPFYKPGAPRRRQIGSGYNLIGIVVSAADCEPIPNANIEIWMAGPEGEYSDAYRATIKTDRSAAYRFQSHFPSGYYGRPPHLHMKISAKGYETLVTQHYPEDGQVEGVFDIVLIPDR